VGGGVVGKGRPRPAAGALALCKRPFRTLLEPVRILPVPELAGSLPVSLNGVRKVSRKVRHTSMLFLLLLYKA
jgi:hypothetical protein